MKELNSWENLLFRAGAVLMLAGAAAHLFAPMVSLYLFAIGAGAYAPSIWAGA